MIFPTGSGLKSPYQELLCLTSWYTFPITIGIRPPTRLMAIIANGRKSIELCDAYIPRDLGMFVYQILHCCNALLNRCSSLGHPVEKYSAQAPTRFIYPIVVDFTFGKPT